VGDFRSSGVFRLNGSLQLLAFCRRSRGGHETASKTTPNNMTGTISLASKDKDDDTLVMT
jgi:hypothetical protein